jgi:hypothetical protein
MAFGHIRKFVFQNPASGKIYEVVIKLNTDGTVDGVGLLLGTNKINSDPDFDNAGKVTFVVLTASANKVFGDEKLGVRLTTAALDNAAIYDVSNRGAAGAQLSTLLV